MKYSQDKKIVFINPPSPGENVPCLDIPLGIGYLSGYLKQFGFYNISLVDFTLLNYPYLDFNNKEYLGIIPKSDIYAVTGTTPQFHWIKEIINYTKKENPDSTVILGGHHASCRPIESYDRLKPDYTVVGEGEKVLLEICANRLKKGIVTGKYVKVLDELPFPDRELIDFNLYKRTLKGNRAFHIVSSRGCPYNCSFCDKASVGRNVRFRTAGNFITEIDYLISKYNVKAYVIYDDIFTLKKNRCIKIARALGERDVLWRCWTRSDTIDKETLKVMKDNGLTSMTVGIESGSDKMLKIYNKGITREQNIEFLLLCKELDIPVRCSLIYGGPYETKDTLEETISLVGLTQPDEWSVSTFIPIPGSAIGDSPHKYDIIILHDSEYLNYYRIGTKTGLGNIAVKISTMTEKEYKDNRVWFVERLEEICKKRVIQDSFQTIKI